MGTLSMEVIMASEEKPATVAVKTGKAGGQASGTIRYNHLLDSWQCRDASDRMVLSIGSKELAIQSFPTFTVKE